MSGQRSDPNQQRSKSLEARVRRIIEHRVVDRKILKDLESEASLSGNDARPRGPIMHAAMDRAFESDLDKLASLTAEFGEPAQDEAAENPGLVSGQKPSKPGRNGNVPPKEHRFKPGQSGNPTGRPSLSLTKMLRDILEENDRRYAKALVRS